jgi:hydantoinase/carbamoylase family amidase
VTGTAAGVLARAAALGEISEEPGRLTRRFATGALRAAGDLVAEWMAAAGMDVRRDDAGNVVGSYAGTGDDARPPFALGSHLDTVPGAGRYDGVLGVLVAVAAVQRLATRGERLAFPLEVAAFADEEGARFGVAYLGSTAYAGLFEPAWLHLVDESGTTVTDALRSLGDDPDALLRASRPTLAGYLEVHIEQGPVLEHEDLPVGVVTAISGRTRASIGLRGQPGHAGTLPMPWRHDALAAAAEAVLAVEEIGGREDGLVATVGTLSVEPGAANVVPGAVTFSLDVRHVDDRARGRAAAEMRDVISRIAATRQVELDWEVLQETPAVAMAPWLRQRLVEAIEAGGLRAASLVSGAGHDAVVLARVCDAAMLFVRCAGGISHDPRESVDEADVAVAIDVVERFLLGAGLATPSPETR